MHDGARPALDSLAFVGFGEAGIALIEAIGDARPVRVSAYDIKTDGADAEAKRADYAAGNIAGGVTLAEALDGAATILSVVTADQALLAARSAARALGPGALYCDRNSVSPATKRAAAEAIGATGGRYVDVAVMSPVRPALANMPLLLAGSHAQDAEMALRALGLSPRVVGGDIGSASAIKMLRSVMIKGLEALTAECALAAIAAGVDDEVLDSLEASDPGFGWRRRIDYNLDRMIVHGRRRAAELEEVATTVAELGLDPAMVRAATGWQRRIGSLGLAPPPEGLVAKAVAIRAGLDREPHGTGHYFGDTSRYIDAPDIPAGDRAKVFEENARRVYPRLDKSLKERGL